MITKGDDYPIHQTADPIAFSGTDRNFYDRYFFNGYTDDGQNYFAVAFGVYPHLNIADAHFSVIRDGKQYSVHASRHLGMERLNLEVGPIAINIIEPLQVLEVVIDNFEGISATIRFEGSAFPIQEPRFTHRFGPRAFMDYTRMTQRGTYTGWIEIDGKKQQLDEQYSGIRDRSWGIRPVGESDPQAFAPAVPAGFFWIWAPVNVAGTSYFFHVCADGNSTIWNKRGAIAPDGSNAERITEVSDTDVVCDFLPKTRYLKSATVTLRPERGTEISISYQPITRFLMRGLGYFDKKWHHGKNQGPLCVEREDLNPAELNVADTENVHTQAISRVEVKRNGVMIGSGIGILESLVQGPNTQFGFSEANDTFQANFTPVSNRL